MKTKNKTVPFTVVVPAVLPCQSNRSHNLQVEVETTEGVDVLTAEAHRIIDSVKIQDSISMLCEAVRILHETINRR